MLDGLGNGMGPYDPANEGKVKCGSLASRLSLQVQDRALVERQPCGLPVKGLA